MSKLKSEIRSRKYEGRKVFFKIPLSYFLLLTSYFLISFTSCSTSFDSNGIYHRVRGGEDMLWIAKSYGVDLQDLAEVNNIEDTERALTPGNKLYIPPKRFYRHKKLPFEGKLLQHIEGAKKPRFFKKGGRKKGSDSVYTAHDQFFWPVEGAVISPFGIRHGRRHDGVDIRAKQGTPIQAANEGRVVFAGTMRGYGNLILIRHEDNFFTAYAHNQANLAKENQKVKKGEVIGRVGRTGRATGAHLHFEVREGDKARNPLFFLPVMR